MNGPAESGFDPNLDGRLDEALEERFPASDPPSVSRLPTPAGAITVQPDAGSADACGAD